MRVRPMAAMLTTLAALAAQPAAASFHLMQIQQVIGGVNGSTKYQAIQLRMRFVGQSFVAGMQLVAHDAAGNNPVVLLVFPSNVSTANLGSTILFATSSFSNATVQHVAPDFILTNPIPEAYLAAGSLTYEDQFGDFLWRLSWGGASYTGSGSGGLTNDGDGNYNPAFPGPLPSTGAQALLFKGTAGAASSNNANDYALTTGAATFTNNNGNSGTINTNLAVTDPVAGAVHLSAPVPNPARGAMSYSVDLPAPSRVEVRLLDLAGRTVRNLIDQPMSAGHHTLEWTPTTGPRLPGGIYFLDLRAAGTRRVQRFALLE